MFARITHVIIENKILKGVLKMEVKMLIEVLMTIEDEVLEDETIDSPGRFFEAARSNKVVFTKAIMSIIDTENNELLGEDLDLLEDLKDYVKGEA